MLRLSIGSICKQYWVYQMLSMSLRDVCKYNQHDCMFRLLGRYI